MSLFISCKSFVLGVDPLERSNIIYSHVREMQELPYFFSHQNVVVVFSVHVTPMTTEDGGNGNFGRCQAWRMEADGAKSWAAKMGRWGPQSLGDLSFLKGFLKDMDGFFPGFENLRFWCFSILVGLRTGFHPYFHLARYRSKQVPPATPLVTEHCT